MHGRGYDCSGTRCCEHAHLCVKMAFHNEPSNQMRLKRMVRILEVLIKRWYHRYARYKKERIYTQTRVRGLGSVELDESKLKACRKKEIDNFCTPLVETCTCTIVF